MTKKELLEAIKDMPEDAEVLIDIGDEYRTDWVEPEIEYNKDLNVIRIC